MKANQYDLEIRNKLLIASNKAGLAFSNTKTAAAHSISYPLTLHYNIVHGIASSISLVPLLQINGGHIHDSLVKICEKNELTEKGLINKIKSIPENIDW